MIKSSRQEGGAVLRLTIDEGKGNVLSSPAIAQLSEAIEAARIADGSLRCVLIDAAGPDFSFGASVEEHRPDQVRIMLTRFHILLRELVSLPLPVLVAVQGRCLGGGLELALAGSRLFAHPSAKLGAPEIQLGVFAPAASVLLPLRVRQSVAEDLLLSGRTVDAAEGLALGLVDEVCAADESPAERALAYARRTVLGHSASSLHYATRAARIRYAAVVGTLLDDLERLYLLELMRTEDAREGIDAFLEKRAPRWKTQREVA